MKFDEIVRQFGGLPWFDFEMVHLMSGETDECVHTELYRWRQAGKIVELRRGLFSLADPWRRWVAGSGSGDTAGAVTEGRWRDSATIGAVLAGGIYPPSYLSAGWALWWWGLFEGDFGKEYTSVTARPAREFENAFGRFSYATLPRDMLFGTVNVEAAGRKVRVASPEKALLDFCFIEGGEWGAARWEGLGLDARNIRKIDCALLGELASRSGRPRLKRAAKSFGRMAKAGASSSGVAIAPTGVAAGAGALAGSAKPGQGDNA
jgi:hypothetical protein